LLADVYLAMTAGQGDLGLSSAVSRAAPIRAFVSGSRASGAESLDRKARRKSPRHALRLAAIDATSKGRCRWRLE